MAYHAQNGLYKTKRGAIFGGVCAGLSEYLRIDVVLLRVITLLLVLGFGSGIVIYVALWIVLPEK